MLYFYFAKNIKKKHRICGRELMGKMLNADPLLYSFH